MQLLIVEVGYIKYKMRTISMWTAEIHGMVQFNIGIALHRGRKSLCNELCDIETVLETVGNLPSGAIGAFKDFKISVPSEVLQELESLLKISPIAKAIYESTRPDRSSE
jgi:hypothetical protein